MLTRDPSQYLLRLFSTFGSVRNIAPGEMLARQGTEIQWVDFLQQGTVKLVDGTASGGHRIVGTRRAGHLVRAYCHMGAQSHSLSVVALDLCIVHRLAISNYVRLLKSDYTFTLAILGEALHEAEVLSNTIARLTSGPARDRVRELLRTLAFGSVSPLGTEDFFRLVTPLRDWEMAQLVAITPEHFSRTLRALEAAHVVRRHRGWIFVAKSLVPRTVTAGKCPGSPSRGCNAGIAGTESDDTWLCHRP